MVTRALRVGIVAALARLELTAALYLVGVLLAGMPTLLAARGLVLFAFERPWAEDLLSSRWAAVVVEVVAAASTARVFSQAPPGLAAGAAWLAMSAVATALVLVAQGLAYALLAGGFIQRLRGDGPFWDSCLRWFWPFVRLGLLDAWILAGGGLLGAGLVAMVGGPASVSSLVVAAIWLSTLNGWSELARVEMVVREERGAWAALRRVGAAALQPARLPGLLAVWALLGIVGLAIATMQGLAIFAAPSVLSLVVAQAALVAGAWLKVVRLGAALSLWGQLAPVRLAHPDIA